MRHISIELSEVGISKAIQEIKAYEKSLDYKLDMLIKKLADLGLETAQNAVPEFTGKLKSGLYLKQDANHGYMIVAENDHAAFVEFGTGVVGQGTYQGKLPAGYQYGVGSGEHDAAHEDDGWWFWFPEKGDYVFTRGQQASAYMLESAEHIRSELVSVAKEVFSND